MTTEVKIEFSKMVRAAIKADDVDGVAALLEARRNLLDAVTPFGTWLHVAATAGSLDVTKKLVEMGADIDKCGGTFDAGPLKVAASYGNVEIVRFLLEQGATLDLSEPFRNPLFGAIHIGHLAIVKLLIERGLDSSVKYSGEVMKDMDAIAYAEQQGRFEIAEFLKSLV
jgi:uncharacterized protein